MPQIEIRIAGPADSAFIHQTLTAAWGGTLIAVHGELIDASAQPALIAWRSGKRAGLLTYRVEPGGQSWEILSLNATEPGAGVGSALIKTIRAMAHGSGARRLWVITTNNNTYALRFYQRQGFDLIALHRDAVSAARQLKPSIPAELDGICLRHELEFELEP